MKKNSAPSLHFLTAFQTNQAYFAHRELLPQCHYRLRDESLLDTMKTATRSLNPAPALLHHWIPRIGSAQVTDEETRMREGGGFIHLWRTESFPATIQGPWTEYHNKQIPLSDKIGTTVRIVDMTPHLSSPMHRTLSLDFGVVLSGEVVLELDNGIETTVKPGDTVVQRGTIHAWHNRTDKIARVLFVLVPSEKVVVRGQTLEQTRFAVN